MLFFSNSLFSQLSQKHYIPPLTYAGEGNANPEEQFIYISTPSDSFVSFTITEVGSVTTPDPLFVSKNSPQLISIGTGDSQLFVNPAQTSTIHSDKGYIIEANGGQIYVSVRARAGGSAQAGALVSKGAAALGKIFRAGMFNNESPQTNYLNFISVMATEDDTKVNFSDLAVGITVENSSNGENIPEISLNEGESYIVATNAGVSAINADGLIGTLIEADKDIVVNVGSANGSFGTGGGRDYGLDQIVDITQVGTEYIFVRGSGADDWENALIVAHEDNTDIEVGGNIVATIDSGEYFLIEGDEYSSNDNMYVQTTQPVFAYQGIGGLNNTGEQREANQGMFFVPPLSCESRGNVDNIAQIDRIGDAIFTGNITIITNTGATVLINEQPISTFNLDGPNSVEGNTDYVTYKVTGLSGNISVESDGELYCAYFNQNGSATSGSFYSGFLTAPEINFNTEITTLGSCIPNVTLEAPDNGSFDSFTWQYFNERTATWEIKSTDTSYKPIESEPGRYRLVGKIDCNPTEEYISSEIPVSICPEDYDEDGIIDNIDQDIDNDGIINCNESIGDINIDFTDIDNPIPEGNITTTISGVFAGNNSDGFTNFLDGYERSAFTSVVQQGIASDNTYTVTFSEKVNLELTQNTGSTHNYTQKEIFIVSLTDPTKNITLLNPDGNLLVDTNFDDVYETGVTQFSASEIRFQFSSTNITNYTYSFVSSKISEIIFTHLNNESTESSTFNGNLKITCYQKDSDNDGVEDAYDLDSDNDGIPDLYELVGEQIALSNVDDNADGVDDSIDAVVYLDSDNDGIFNFLDLDSDNDGIFDSTEAGHNLDTDFDGTVDNIANVGINGVENSLENSDLGNLDINYTITDTDGDNSPNFIELDSDNDDCFDTTEAGFTDDNKDGILDASPFAIDDNGKIINNTDGYTTPNTDYITSAPIELNAPFEDVVFCENDTETISIDANADNYFWFVSDDDGVSFVAITNDATYTINNEELILDSVPASFNNNQYKVELQRNGNACTTEEIVTLTVNLLPTPNAIAEINECASNQFTTTVNLEIAEINIIDNSGEEYSFEYFETEADAIAGSNQLTEEEYQSYDLTVNITRNAWVRTINISSNCYEVSQIQATATFTPDVTFNDTVPACDDKFYIDESGNEIDSDKDGISSFDFSGTEQTILDEITTSLPSLVRSDLEVLFFETETDRDASINSISDISNYRNSTPDSQTIYIKINNKTNNECQGIGEFPIIVNPLPEFSVEGEAPDAPLLKCLNLPPLVLEVENPEGTYLYSWTNENNDIIGVSEKIDVFAGGNYTVTATIEATGCTRSRTITVDQSDIVPLADSFIFINDNIENPSNSDLSVFIDVTQIGLTATDYLYALASQNGTIIRSFQDSPVFENLEGGLYTVLVENIDGCGTSEFLISVIEIPKYFTPNGDGLNDYFTVKGVDPIFYTTANIKIFDRYGKLLSQTTVNELGWDGTINGASVSEDDYWYSIDLIPVDPTRNSLQKTGHFSLIKNR
ncbi:T9SS type B sorting domain-containing protein [Polaribacter sp.]|nr:T9SS type B sorting domain-containing protein [Polaribacter sp.]